MSRMLRFVRAARALLWMQLAAALLATGLGVWAVVAVRDLALERDRLLAEVAEIRRARPAPAVAATPDGLARTPLDTEVRPPAIMPVFVPIVQGPEIPEIPPVETPPPDAATGTPVPGTQPAQDCTANPNQPRCRPGRWSRRDPPVTTQPTPPVREERQRPGGDAPQR